MRAHVGVRACVCARAYMSGVCVSVCFVRAHMCSFFGLGV